MTTRRGALGAIIGGVTAGPAAVTSAAEAVLAGDLSTATMTKALVGLAPEKAKKVAKQIAYYQRILNGERDPDEYHNDGTLTGDDDHYERYYAALKSMSPMVRGVLLHGQKSRIEKAASIRYATTRLRQLLSGND